MIPNAWVYGRVRSVLENPFLCVLTKWMTPTVHSVYYATRSLSILSIHKVLKDFLFMLLYVFIDLLSYTY